MEYFAVTGSTASTTRKIVNDVWAQTIRHLEIEIRVDDSTLNLQEGGFLLTVFFKCVLKSNYNLPRNAKTITKSFFSAVNVTGFSVIL